VGVKVRTIEQEDPAARVDSHEPLREMALWIVPERAGFMGTSVEVVFDIVTTTRRMRVLTATSPKSNAVLLIATLPELQPEVSSNAEERRSPAQREIRWGWKRSFIVRLSF
jgi:hypothetical protein